MDIFSVVFAVLFALLNFGLYNCETDKTEDAPKVLKIRSYPPVIGLQSPLYEVYAPPYFAYNTMSAIALLQGEDESAVKGELIFTETIPNGPVLITGNITGLPEGKHGLHIHQSGDMRHGCEKLGGHFNPFQLPHGSPENPIRHVGDLGNIEAGDDSETKIEMVDHLMSLVGPRGVVGRAVVITAEEDDFGKANTIESETTGSTEKPIACGIIAFIK